MRIEKELEWNQQESKMGLIALSSKISVQRKYGKRKG